MRKHVIYARAAADPRVMYAWRVIYGTDVMYGLAGARMQRRDWATPSLEAKFGVKPREAQ
ncbi:MAG: hypothetical protein JO230_06035 [Xanthobacteraceae bacterium]|nr:hypothetical protein [Xanthobacteraceae bacterium]